MQILIPLILLFFALGTPGNTSPQPVMSMPQATANAQSSAPVTRRHAGRTEHRKQFCWNFAGLPIPSNTPTRSSAISISQVENLLANYANLEQSFLPTESVVPESAFGEYLQLAAEQMLTDEQKQEIENYLEEWTEHHNKSDEDVAKEKRHLTVKMAFYSEPEEWRPTEQYLLNRSVYEMSAPVLRGQLLAELAKRKFDAGEYEMARELANQALEEIENSRLAISVAPYQITIEDTQGHREPEFAVSLAFLVKQLSEYALAEASGSPLEAYTAAHGLVSEWLAVDSLYSHLISDNAYAKTVGDTPHRFDPEGWTTGSSVMNSLLSHFTANALIAHDLRSPEKHWKDLPGHAANAIFIHEGALYADFQTDSPTETLSLQIGDAGDGVIPPVDAFRFTDAPLPRTVRLMAGGDLRDNYLRWLRAEVNQHSTPEVPFFAAIVEPGGYRLVLAPELLQAAPEDLLGEYDTFFVSETDIENFAEVSDFSPGGQFLRDAMATLEDKMFTLYTAALHRVPGARQTAIDDMVFQLAAAFPNNVLRDIFTEETTPRAEAAQTRLFGGPNDFVLLTASDDVALQDFGIVDRLREKYIEPLKRQGMAEMIYNGQNAFDIARDIGGEDRRILIVTAHSDAELEHMLHDLGKAGAFRNNTVLAYTCRTETSREMTEFVGGSGANGTWVFDREILVDDAVALLDRTFQAIRDPDRTDQPMREIVPTLTEDYISVFSISELTLPFINQQSDRAG